VNLYQEQVQVRQDALQYQMQANEQLSTVKETLVNMHQEQVQVRQDALQYKMQANEQLSTAKDALDDLKQKFVDSEKASSKKLRKIKKERDQSYKRESKLESKLGMKELEAEVRGKQVGNLQSMDFVDSLLVTTGVKPISAVRDHTLSREDVITYGKV
jgi:hypothetical protein